MVAKSARSGATIAVLLASCVPSLAADPAGVAPRSWTGCYVGVTVGLAAGHGSVTDLPYRQGPFAGSGFAWNSAGPDYESFGMGSSASPSGGGEAGCDIELPLAGVPLVVGAVADISLFDLSSHGRSRIASDTRIGYDARWAATARARAGFAVMPDLLVYASGGISVADLELHAVDRQVFPTFGLMDLRSDDTEVGWVVGAGAEWRVAANWSIVLEYLHHEFDATATGPAIVPAGAYPRFDGEVRLETVRAALKWRF